MRNENLTFTFLSLSFLFSSLSFSLSPFSLLLLSQLWCFFDRLSPLFNFIVKTFQANFLATLLPTWSIALQWLELYFVGRFLATDLDMLNFYLDLPSVPGAKDASVLMGTVYEKRLLVADWGLEGVFLVNIQSLSWIYDCCWDFDFLNKNEEKWWTLVLFMFWYNLDRN